MIGNELFRLLTNLGEKLTKEEAKGLMKELCEPEDDDGFMPFFLSWRRCALLRSKKDRHAKIENIWRTENIPSCRKTQHLLYSFYTTMASCPSFLSWRRCALLRSKKDRHAKIENIWRTENIPSCRKTQLLLYSFFT